MRRSIKQEPKEITIKKATISPDILINKSEFMVTNKTKVIASLDLDYDEYDLVVADYKPAVVYERLPYISISNDDKLDYDEIIRSLTLREYKVFKYIKSKLPFCSNYIKLSTDDVLRIINDKYKPNAYSVLKGLIDKKIIARAKESDEKDIIIINHNLFFKGSYNKFCYKYNKVYGNE